MERTYYLDLGDYDAYITVFIDGESVRIDKVRFFDLDLIEDRDIIKKLRHKYPRNKILDLILAKYDPSGKVKPGLWIDPEDGKVYDVHTVVPLKDGFESYVLARDVSTWKFVLLDIERMSDE